MILLLYAEALFMIGIFVMLHTVKRERKWQKRMHMRFCEKMDSYQRKMNAFKMVCHPHVFDCLHRVHEEVRGIQSEPYMHIRNASFTETLIKLKEKAFKEKYKNATPVHMTYECMDLDYAIINEQMEKKVEEEIHTR